MKLMMNENTNTENVYKPEDNYIVEKWNWWRENTTTETIYKPEDNYIAEKSNRWRVKLHLQKVYIHKKTTI
jgi:hypothetical protein